jgi:acetylornithine/succinyldiaminopimelate/putrescine aminotransferase
LLKQHVADVMIPGDHGSTFAGNPLVCNAGCVTFDIISDPSFLEAVVAKVRRPALAMHVDCVTDTCTPCLAWAVAT